MGGAFFYPHESLEKYLSNSLAVILVPYEVRDKLWRVSGTHKVAKIPENSVN